MKRMMLPVTLLALMVLPTIAAAECGWKHETASQCAEGQAYDQASGTCVTQKTS
ncbi:hypothetical protein [Tropicimonas sp.]|uniref:hypothetical protein n=1 Tax=Tropicimonas sp. TaxID=2067044 RepID=UPI003A89F5EB